MSSEANPDLPQPGGQGTGASDPSAAPPQTERASEPSSSNWKRFTILFLGGQAVSLFGSALVQFALLWYVTMGTQSGAMVTVATIVGFVPMVILAPIGGVLADRMNRRFLIVGADALVALSTLGLLLAFAAGYGSYTLVFTVMAIRAFGGGIQGPAVSALLPQIVPSDKLGKVNGYNASIQASVSLFAPMAAGALYAFASIEWILAIDLITAAIGIGILLLFVRVPLHKGAAAASEQSGLRDLKDGVAYIRAHVLVRKLIGYFALVNFFITPLALLTPLQVTRTFANDPKYLAAAEMAFGVGMFLGGLLIGSWGGFKSRVTTIGAALAATGTLTAVLGLPVLFAVYLATMFVLGVLLPAINTPTITILQLAVEERFMGRVFSVISMIGTGALPLAMLIFGPLSDRVSVEVLLIVSGAILAALGIAMLLDKSARRLEPTLADLPS